MALDRIIIHNAVFPDSALKVIGFGRNERSEFVVLVEQPYIKGVGVAPEERKCFMHNLGFEDAGEDYGMCLNYKTSTLYIGDLNEYNIIKGEEGIHVIDADCRLNTPTLGCGEITGYHLRMWISADRAISRSSIDATNVWS